MKLSCIQNKTLKLTTLDILLSMTKILTQNDECFWVQSHGRNRIKSTQGFLGRWRIKVLVLRGGIIFGYPHFWYMYKSIMRPYFVNIGHPGQKYDKRDTFLDKKVTFLKWHPQATSFSKWRKPLPQTCFDDSLSE